jgi:hypothetical protein
MNNAPSAREVAALLEIMAEIGHRRSASSSGHILMTDEKLWPVRDLRKIRTVQASKFLRLRDYP